MITDQEYLEILKKWNIHPSSKEGKSFLVRAKRYGVSARDLIQLFNDQAGRCKVCEAEISIIKNVMGYANGVIDHCHKTGVVRGWLCMACNVKVGHIDALTADELEISLINHGIRDYRTRLKDLSVEEYLKLIQYTIDHINLQTSNVNGNHAHEQKAERFLEARNGNIYSLPVDFNPEQRRLLVLWLKNKGIKGQIFKSDDSTVGSIVIIETTEEKRIHFEDRFLNQISTNQVDRTR